MYILYFMDDPLACRRGRQDYDDEDEEDYDDEYEGDEDATSPHDDPAVDPASRAVEGRLDGLLASHEQFMRILRAEQPRQPGESHGAYAARVNGWAAGNWTLFLLRIFKGFIKIIG